MPAVSNVVTILLKASAVTAILTVSELTLLAGSLVNQTVQPIPVLLVIATYYLIIGVLLGGPPGLLSGFYLKVRRWEN